MTPRADKRPEVKVELYWTIDDVAKRLHAGRSTVNKWITAGQLVKMKAGARTLISESALQKFLSDQNQAA